MEALTIRIYAATEGGYLYDIYDTDVADNIEPALESVDGGLCTTTMRNALGMAVQQAEAIIVRRLGDECPGCGIDLRSEKGCEESAFGHGLLDADCREREAFEGDFISER